MDGYAARVQDIASAEPDRPVRLPVVGEVPAGQAAPHRLSPGTAMKIMTGAPLPAGADTIVPYEATDRGTDDVLIFTPSEPGQHVRRAGEDIEAGDVVLQAGDQLGPRSIGLLAGIGRDKVLVRPRPRVVVIATGSELVHPGLPLPRPEMIYDSNSFLLAAAARAAGAQVFRVGLVSDDPDEVKQLISDQLVRADLILTTGGVSQGDYDVVKAVLPELGCHRLRLGRHAAGETAGIRPDRRGSRSDVDVARQSGELLRLVRGLRPARPAQTDGRGCRTSEPPSAARPRTP